MPRTSDSRLRRRWMQGLALLTGLGGLSALLISGGCGDAPELQPAETFSHRVLSDSSRNDELANNLAAPPDQAPGAPPATTGKGDVLPIFPIGDDYRMMELPDNNASPATTDDTGGKKVPLAFYIPARADAVTGRPEKLRRLAVGVLFRDSSGAQPVYRLADFTRAKLGSQLCQKAFNSFSTEKDNPLPEDLKLDDGYPAIFSAAFIYRDLDTIEHAPPPALPPPPPTPANSAAKPAKPATPAASSRSSTSTTAADGLTLAGADPAQPPARKIRIIRTDDMESFLKETKSDVLALLVVEADDQGGQERLVALWLWGRDPVTHGLFTPSACVQANKIDEQWPEATEPEMLALWQSMIDLERRLAASKTVSVNLPHKTP